MKALNEVPGLEKTLRAHVRCLNYRHGSISDKSSRFCCLANLARKDLSRINFSYQNLSRARMTWVTAEFACFDRADLSEVHGAGAVFNDSTMIKANLQGAHMYSAQFNRCSMSHANLHCAYLAQAQFQTAYLFGANFQNADLSGANLRDADLRYANFAFCQLAGADLTDAEIEGANFIGANLNGAILTGLEIDETCLLGAELNDAKTDKLPLGYYPLACPSDGEFIGWKAVNDCLVKLLIPADAKRSSATSRKCRCNKAIVLSIENFATHEEVGKIESDTWAPITYKVGEMVYPDRFDTNRFNECSNGIHFFINKIDAINYGNLW